VVQLGGELELVGSRNDDWLVVIRLLDVFVGMSVTMHVGGGINFTAILTPPTLRLINSLGFKKEKEWPIKCILCRNGKSLIY
jgi:hypothetical protein